MSKQNKITIDINAVVNGQQQVGQLSVNLGELQRASERARQGMEAIKWSAVAQGAESLSSSIGKLQQTFADWSAAYAVQEQAETQLAQVMRERMDATDAEIDSIKRLCSAQQELGVIGDEVQLAAAQQLATFVDQRQTIESLLPAMNDLLAQQKGLNATSQDAVNVANVFGKAMTGNTNVLKRMGITLTDAQKSVLETGTEMERAAVLAEVVQQKAGGMNAALAQTSSGKLKQLSNTLGDVKESLGATIAKVQPFITLVATSATATAGVIKLGAGLKAATVAVRGFDYASKLSAVSAWLLGVRSGQTTKALRVMTTELYTGRNAALALRIAFQALVRSVAILALIDIALRGLMALLGKTEDAAEGVTDAFDDQADSARALERSLNDVSKKQADFAGKQDEIYLAEIKNVEKLYKKATDETRSRQERIKAIREMQSQYPSYFSNINAELLDVNALTAAYDKLKNNIREVAKARAAEEQLVENEKRMLETKRRIVEIKDGTIANDPTNQYYYENYNKQVDRFNYYQEAYSHLDDFFISDTEERNIKRSATGLFHDLNPGADSPDFGYSDAADYLRQNLPKMKAALDQELAAKKAVEHELNDLTQEQQKLQEWQGELEQYVKSAEGLSIEPVEPTGPGRETDVAKYTKDAKTLKEIEDNITVLQAELKSSTVETAGAINQEIAAWQAKADAIRNAGTETKKMVRYPLPKMLKEIAHNLQVIEQERLTATGKDLERLNNEAEELRKKQNELQNLGIPEKKGNTPELNTSATRLAEIEENIQHYQQKLESATVAEAAAINESIALWQKKADAIRNAGKAQESVFATMRQGWGSFKGINDGITGVVDKLKSHDSAWEKAIAVVDAGLRIYDGVTGVIDVINTLTAANTAAAAASQAQTAANIEEAASEGVKATTEAAATQVTNTEATANLTDAAAKTFNAHAWLPWVGIGMSAAMVALMVAKMGGLPKFAEGGIAYGPTVGLFGEYAGASRNPEVVAPLDRLRDLLQPSGGSIPEHIRLTARGTDLEAVINTRNRRISR